jgi:hypothetical protein
MSQCDCLQCPLDGISHQVNGHHENCIQVRHLMEKFWRIKRVGIPPAQFPWRSWNLNHNGELVLHGEFTEEEKAALRRAAESTGDD